MRVTTLLALTAALAAASPSGAQAPVLVRDFFPGSSGPFLNHGRPYAFREHNGRLLLCANDGVSLAKLFALDDLSGNVEELAQEGGVLGYTTTNGGIITSGDNIYFYAQEPTSTNSILWCVHDGSVEALATIPYSVLFYYIGIPLPGGKLLFIQSDPDHGFEPWITDGTAAGTHLLKDIHPGSTTSIGSPFPLFQGFDFAGKAYFMASDGVNGYQLWTSDGTEAGTSQFATINTADETGAIAMHYSKNDDVFIVATPDGLLSSNGVASANTLIHASTYAWPHTAGLNYPAASGDGWMYFSALEDDWKLYRTRGTEATTELMLSGIPNQGYFHLTELNGLLYVLTADNDHAFLVSIDPATRTSTIVKTFEPDPNSGPNPGSFYGFRNDGQHFYFMGLEGTHARQYWKSDGTLAGTQMVHEFTPSVLNGGPDAASGSMIIFQNTFVFAANDADVGIELWAGEGGSGIAETSNASASVNAWCDADGQLQVRSLGGAVRGVRVMDVAGRMMLEQGASSGDRAAIGAQTLSTGIYLVQVVTTEGTGLVRVLKH